MNGKRVVALILTLLAAGYIYLIHTRSLEKPRSTEAKIDTSYNFGLDAKASYRVVSRQKMLFLADRKHPVEKSLAISCLLNIKILKFESNDSVWAVAELSDIDISSARKGRTRLPKELEKIYKENFLINFDRQGHIKDMLFASDNEIVKSIRQLVYQLQIVNRDYRYYENYEYDINGRYKAVYRKNAYDISKRIISYQDSDIVVKKSDISAIIDDSGLWLKKAEVNETLYFKQSDISIESSIKAQKVKYDPRRNIFLSKRGLDDYKKLLSEKKGRDDEIIRKVQIQKLRQEFEKEGLTLKKITQLLRQKPKDMNTHLLLRKFLKAEPDSAFALLSQLRDFDDYTRMRIIGILGYVDTPQAQKALIEIARDESNEERDRFRAIAAAGTVKRPTKDTLESVREIAQSDNDKDVQNTALLAYGTLSSKIKDSDDLLKNRFYTADSIGEQKVVLYAMENAGADKYMQELEGALRSKSRRVRLLALKILEKTKDKDRLRRLLERESQKQSDKKVLRKIERLLEKLAKR